MVWKIELSKRADRQLSKLDSVEQRRLVDFIDHRLALLDNPRAIGHALTGSRLGEFWRFRVGDYRLVCDIQNDRLVILVLEIGHRSAIYR